MSYPPLATDAMDTGGGRRLSLAPEALWMEARSGSSYVRLRPVTYEEIQAVYTYEVRDWSMAGYMAMTWLLLLAVVFSALAAGGAQVTALVGALIFLAITAATAGFAAYHVATRLRKMMRIDTHTGSLIVPNRHPRFVVSLGQHLEAARARMAAAPPPPPVMGPAAAPLFGAPPPPTGGFPGAGGPPVPPPIGPTTPGPAVVLPPPGQPGPEEPPTPGGFPGSGS